MHIRIKTVLAADSRMMTSRSPRLASTRTGLPDTPLTEDCSMSTMTLGQVRDWLQNCADSNTESSDIRNDFLGDLADAIDAELKARGEPIAWMRDTGNSDDECHVIATVVRDLWIKSGKPKMVERYTIPLFTVPPAPKIEVTDAMAVTAFRIFKDEIEHGVIDFQAMHHALTGALKETL